jgi:hypothetical protein
MYRTPSGIPSCAFVPRPGLARALNAGHGCQWLLRPSPLLPDAVRRLERVGSPAVPGEARRPSLGDGMLGGRIHGAVRGLAERDPRERRGHSSRGSGACRGEDLRRLHPGIPGGQGRRHGPPRPDGRPQGLRRIVFSSTVGMHAASSGPRSISEQDEPAPHDAYTLSRWEAEQELARVCADMGLGKAVVYCPMVYGPGNPGNFLRLPEWVERGIPLPLANARNGRRMIFVENAVQALLGSATHPRAAGQAFLVCDGETVSTPELIRRVAQVLDRPARLLPFPPGWLRALGKWAGRERDADRLLGTLIVDNSKIRKELGWKPPCSISEGIQRTGECYRWRFGTEGRTCSKFQAGV